MEILELKSTIIEKRKSLQQFNNCYELAEGRIIKLEDRLIEIIQSEEQREQRE